MKPASVTSRHAIASRRDAFTLLEMLVATALCSVLLLALWALYSTYANLFDRGQARVERSQLARALMQQIADDLQAAIQDPIAAVPDAGAGEAQRRRFGLAGSSRELRLDVLQVTPRQGNRIPVGGVAGEMAAETEPRVPELRTVYYSFAEPHAAGDTEPDAGFEVGPAGLVRREVDFETPVSEVDPFEADPAEAADSLSSDATPGPGSTRDEQIEAAVDDRWTWVPEVLSVDFRYYDGRGWSSSWNSLQRKSLPVAVEVRIALADPGGPGRSRAASESQAGSESVDAAASGELSEEEIAAGEVAAEETALSAPATVLQMIVDLPASAEYRQGRAAERAPQRTPARIPVRRIAPRRWTSPTPPRQLPEDWLRTRTP